MLSSSIIDTGVRISSRSSKHQQELSAGTISDSLVEWGRKEYIHHGYYFYYLLPAAATTTFFYPAIQFPISCASTPVMTSSTTLVGILVATMCWWSERPLQT
jgi:hypothetical protein